MTGQQQSGIRKLNKHWQSGGKGDFAPFLPWYTMSNLRETLGISVVKSTAELSFPVVYTLPRRIVSEDDYNYPVIGVKKRDVNIGNAIYKKGALPLKQITNDFSQVNITIKIKKNTTGIEWYIAPELRITTENTDTGQYTTAWKTADSIAGTGATWYDDTLTTATGQLSSISELNTKTVYSLKDGVTLTYNNEETTWEWFLWSNFRLYYIWDPEIIVSQDDYQSEAATILDTKYQQLLYNNGGEEYTGTMDTAGLKRLMQWEIKITAS